MEKLKLKEEEIRPYRVTLRDEAGKPLRLLPGQSVGVFSHSPLVVRVVQDETPLPDSIASGRLIAGVVPAADVVVQVALDGPRGENLAVSVDVGTVPPEAPKAAPVALPVRKLAIDVAVPQPAPCVQNPVVARTGPLPAPVVTNSSVARPFLFPKTGQGA